MSSHQYNPIIRATIPMACGNPAINPIDLNEVYEYVRISPEQEDLLRVNYQNHVGLNKVSATYRAGIRDTLTILGITIKGVNQ